MATSVKTMIKSITLLVYLSSTLQHVSSFAPRLSDEQLDSFATDKAFAQSYAMQLCEGNLNFWTNGLSFEGAYGNIGESIITENTKLHIDGGKPMEGYSSMAADSYLTRNISEFVMANCTEIVYSDDSLFLKHKIFFRIKKQGVRMRQLGVTSTTTFDMKYFFANASNGTAQKIMIKTVSGKQMLKFFNAAKQSAQAAVSVAQYLGVIEKEVDGSERNIQLLTKLVLIILVLFCVIIGGVVAYVVNLCLRKYDKQRVKYDAVPQIAVDSQ
eukprot:54244_1